MTVNDCGCNKGHMCPTNQVMYFTFLSFVVGVAGLLFTRLLTTKFNINISYLKYIFNFLPFGLIKDIDSETINLMNDSTNKDYYTPIKREDSIFQESQIRYNISSYTTDEKQSQIIKCSNHGCKIWAKNGPHFLIAGKGSDKFFFSLCSTRVINGQVTVIENFNPEQDEIAFFCSKKTITPNDINIIHNNDLTCIEVQGEDHLSPICFAENIDINIEGIILTTLGQTKNELAIED